MSTQFFLDETDIEALTKLMLRSQQLRTREALCIRIGIDPRRLGFIKDSSDYDFVIQLINHLNEISNKEALCKLCCEELFPIFYQSEKYALILSDVAAKLHCNQKLSQNSPNSKQQTVLSSIPASRVSVNPFNQLAKNKLIIGSAIFIIGLAGFRLYNQNSNSPNNPLPTEQPISSPSSGEPTANSEEAKINSIYQKFVGREATIYERKSNIEFLANGGTLSLISNSIAKTSPLLRDGNVISLECLGNHITRFKLLTFRNETVSLASNIDAQFTSTKWKVHVIGGVVALENQGKINGPKWLNGVTSNGSVNLVDNTEGGNTGTKWKINIFYGGFITLENQGEINGPKWLNGVTYDGTVNLVDNTEGGNTGTKWRIKKQ